MAQQSSSKMRSHLDARTSCLGRHGLRKMSSSSRSVSIGMPDSSCAVASLRASGSYDPSTKPLGGA
eukprot:931505-Alexandrium_andersonii.AAC.1